VRARRREITRRRGPGGKGKTQRANGAEKRVVDPRVVTGYALRQTLPEARQAGSSELKRNYRDGGVKGDNILLPRWRGRGRGRGRGGRVRRMGLIYYRAMRAE